VGVVSLALAAVAAHTGTVPIATAVAERSGTTAAGRELSGTSWKAKRIDGRAVPRGYGATIRFEERFAEGRHWCNGYRGRYEAGPGSRLRFGRFTSTLRGCSGIEDPPDFLGALSGTRTYRRARGRLVLLDADGTAIVRLVRRR
jgi:heat shock protein HslJ